MSIEAQTLESNESPRATHLSSRGSAVGIAICGDPAEVDLDHRLLNGTIFLAGIAGLLSTIQNLVVGTSVRMVVASLVCMLGGVVGYVAARRSVRPGPLKTAIFSFYLVVLSVCWITQAGSQGTIGYYFVLLACTAIVLFHGRAKIVWLGLTGVTVAALFVVEYGMPSVIMPYASSLERFADVAVALPCCLAMSGAVILLVYREYQRERAAKDKFLEQVTAEKERVERGMLEKQRLLTVVSHDIANALTVLQGEISLSRLATRAERAKPCLDLDRMAYACTNIDEIISSVRMMEALEQGRVTFRAKPVDLAAVFEYAEVIFGKRLAHRRMRFEFPELDEQVRFVMAEPRILANQVFGNLLSNAIKFSYPESRIAVTVTRQNGDTTIRIFDHGIGIPRALLPSLFDLDANTTRAGTDGEPGTGFGLRTVKHFVELFGGRLDITSRSEKEYPDNHGTTVAIRLKSGQP
jgi:signal transduction histidine kinase